MGATSCPLQDDRHPNSLNQIPTTGTPMRQLQTSGLSYENGVCATSLGVVSRRLVFERSLSQSIKLAPVVIYRLGPRWLPPDLDSFEISE